MISKGTLSGNDASVQLVVTPVAHAWQGTKRRLYIQAGSGDDGSGTFTVYRSPNEGTDLYEIATINKDATLDFEYLPGEEYYLGSSAGTAPVIDYWIF